MANRQSKLRQKSGGTGDLPLTMERQASVVEWMKSNAQFLPSINKLGQKSGKFGGAGDFRSTIDGVIPPIVNRQSQIVH
jgi:hypothetical protein